MACLAALQRHGECLALVNKRLEEETENPDLFIMRARLHELFRNVSMATLRVNGQLYKLVCDCRFIFSLKVVSGLFRMSKGSGFSKIHSVNMADNSLVVEQQLFITHTCKTPT